MTGRAVVRSQSSFSLFRAKRIDTPARRHRKSEKLDWLRLALAALILCGCEEGEQRSRSSEWPPGTAVLVCGVAIPTTEVERAAELLAEVNPAWTRRAMLREALVAQLVPRAAAQSAFANAAERARARLVLGLAALRTAAADAPVPALVERPAAGLPFDLWSVARELPLEEWHGPFLGIGRWFALRVLARERRETRALDSYRLELVVETFAPPSTRPEEILADCELVVVDPAFEELVPLSLRNATR